MKRSIAPIATLAAILAGILATGSAQAWECKYHKDIDVTVDLSKSQHLNIAAGAGELNITGVKGGSEAHARGQVCASKEEWLKDSELVTSDGAEAGIAVSLPDTDGRWSLWGNSYIYMDLEVEVPDGIELAVRDSSGDIRVRGTGTIAVEDSSGDIEIRDTKGGVTLDDSSGDIELENIGGDVLVQRDSSGGIRGRSIHGSVRVERDSSGDIRFSDVTGDFVVERDSSGDIVADAVGGDFRVLRDGSGDIVSHDVSGEVQTPENG